MSVDLLVVRATPAIAGDELSRTLASLSGVHPGFSTYCEHDPSVVIGHFWQVGRASLVYTRPDPTELDDVDIPELRSPHVVVSSRSGAWPWVEFIAVELARALGGAVYDPQEGALYPELVAEHSLRSLRALHEAAMAELQPVLVTTYSGYLGPGNDLGGLKALIGHAGAILGIDIAPGDQALMWSHEANEVKLSSYPGYETSPRTLTVRGPAATDRVHEIARELGARLGVQLYRCDEYRGS